MQLHYLHAENSKRINCNRYSLKTALSIIVFMIPFCCPGVCLSTPNSQKKGYGRPKSAEPGSPLLRRALSPDRLHPRSAENKTSISPLANTVVKVTPRVTIAQSSHSETSDEAGDGFKEAGDAKSEKKVPSEQKADYSKLTHGISINLGNVSMSNSCAGTQLPRIAEEKDSPTGSKADDYTSKEISEKSEKQSTSGSQSGDVERAGKSDARCSKEQPAIITAGGKVSHGGKKEETAGVSASTQQVPHGTTATSQKHVDQRHGQAGEKSTTSSTHKAHMSEQKASAKGNVEAHQDARKLLKKHKVESTDGAHSSTHESNAPLGKDKKSN